MRIVHVEDYFIPDAGYQINILPKYQVKLGHEVFIVTSTVESVSKPNSKFFGTENIINRDKVYSETTGVKIIRIPTKINRMISNRIIQSKHFFRVIDNLEPDIAFIHGNDTLTGMRFLLRNKKIDYPFVMDSHMVEMASANRFNKIFRIIYKLFFTQIIVKRNIFVIRTQNSSYINDYLGIPDKLTPWISVGSDTLLFYKNKKRGLEERERLGLHEDDFVFIFTGKLDSRRGAVMLANTFKEKFSTSKNVVLLTIGSAVDDEGEQSLEIFKESKNKVINLPTQKYSDLAKYYQLSDVSLFPKLCSLSFYDAQACGLPVIAENNEISKDRLKSNNGFIYESENVVDFRNIIEKMINLAEEEYNILSTNSVAYVLKNYDYKNIAERYTTILESVYSEYHESK